jgi:hypothetical protein
VLLAITFFPKCLLAPATEKSDGETGVLLAVGYGERKVFHKECESHRCAGVKVTKLMASGTFSTSPAPGNFWYDERPANKDAGQVYDSAWISRDFVISHRGRCHPMMKCECSFPVQWKHICYTFTKMKLLTVR